MTYKPKRTREVVRDLRRAGFERIAGGNAHSRFVHPSGVTIAVPDMIPTISPGVVKQIYQALAEALRRQEMEA